MRIQTAQQQAWQRNFETGFRNAALLREHQAVMAEFQRRINPPPPPEPEVVYVEPYEGSDELGTMDFNPKLWMKKPRIWGG